MDRDTTITLAPITSAQGLSRAAAFVAGVRAGPSGTRFDAPVRLRAELPSGQALSPLGYRGLLIDADGTVRELPASLEGRRVTLGVPHFSDVLVVDNDYLPVTCDDAVSISSQAVTACAAFDGLLASVGTQPIEALLDQQLELLQTWIGALVARAGQADSEGADAGGVYRTLLFSELPLFAIIYGTFGDPFGGPDDRPLAAELNTILQSMEGALLRVGDRLVASCLADKAGAAARMTELDEAWEQHFALFGTLLVGREHCLEIDLQGQVLQPPAQGLPGQVSVALNYRFVDGTPAAGELGLETMAVAFSATQATVAPAGGVVDLPFEQVLTLSLAPGAASTALTVTLTPDVPGLAQTTRELPVTVNQPACEVPQGDTVWQGVASIGAQTSPLGVQLRFEPGLVSGTGGAFGQSGVGEGTVIDCAISLGFGFNNIGSVTFDGLISQDGRSMSGTHSRGGTWTVERQ